MSDRVPFFLFEAVISLYPADAAGQALTGLAVLLGACANRMRAADRYTALKLGSSGDAYKTVRHVDEAHEISFERVWVARKTAPALFMPGRNQQYVLDIVWTSEGVWYRRTYFGVTGSAVELASRGVLEYDANQTFEAQYYTDSGGVVGSQNVYTPTPPAGAQTPVGFFHEEPMPVGDYLLGTYRWGAAVTAVSANVIAWAPQGVATVLTLEVNGSLTAHTVTIPVGTANTEVTGSATFTQALNAGDTVRWKITSGPDNGAQAAWMCALMMAVQVN